MKSRVHVNIGVRDLDRSIAFYSALLGHQPSKLKQGYANFRLDEPPIHLALVENAAAAVAAGGEHHGIELLDDADLAQFQQRLAGAGVSMRVEQNATCCYAVADKVWVSDPDGRPWEVWIRRADAESMASVPAAHTAAPQTSCCATSSCC